MKKLNLRPAVVILATLALTTQAQTPWATIPTNVGNGADAEVREDAPTTPRGANTELATRVINTTTTATTDRNSAMYTRFDLSGLGALPGQWSTAFRLTYRNNTLVGSRIQDTVTPDPNNRTGLKVYGLNPNAAGANWSEATMTYNDAPGITPDGDIGTRDFNSDLILLGEVRFPEIGTQNHLAVGDALIFRSAAFDTFVANALANSVTQITLVSHILHEGDAPLPNWLNFNYLFNPKDMTTLQADTTYDADTTDPNNPLGSPWSAADNSTGLFSPTFIIEVVPEPSTFALAGFGLAMLLALRRRS